MVFGIVKVFSAINFPLEMKERKKAISRTQKYANVMVKSLKAEQTAISFSPKLTKRYPFNNCLLHPLTKSSPFSLRSHSQDDSLRLKFQLLSDTFYITHRKHNIVETKPNKNMNISSNYAANSKQETTCGLKPETVAYKWGTDTMLIQMNSSTRYWWSPQKREDSDPSHTVNGMFVCRH